MPNSAQFLSFYFFPKIKFSKIKIYTNVQICDHSSISDYKLYTG